jgi:hypothetical protein
VRTAKQGCVEGHLCQGATPRAEPVPTAKQGCAEGGLYRGATPRTALGIDYADDHCAYVEGCRPSASVSIPVVFFKKEYTYK